MMPADVIPADFRLHSPAMLRRRLRHACVLISVVEGPDASVEAHASALLRARGHLSGTLDRLDRLIAEVLPATPIPIDDQLTAPATTRRIEQRP